MNKKPLARMLYRPAAQTEPQWPLPGQVNGLPVYIHGHKAKFIQPPKSIHPNVGQIGSSFRDELIQQSDHSLLDELVTQRLQREIGLTVETALYGFDGKTTAANPDRTDLEIEFDLTRVVRVAQEMRRLQEEQTCDVPPELRQRFIDAGISEQDVDRMIIYPNRCSVKHDVVEIIYKLRNEDGNPPKEPSVPSWVHINGMP